MRSIADTSETLSIALNFKILDNVEDELLTTITLTRNITPERHDVCNCKDVVNSNNVTLHNKFSAKVPTCEATDMVPTSPCATCE